MDRRGINPATDLKLFRTYQKLLKAEQPNLVITYSIKPNIYGGLAYAIVGIPYCANVQGLGTAFQRKGLAQFVTVLYKLELGKAKTYFLRTRQTQKNFAAGECFPLKKKPSFPVPASTWSGIPGCREAMEDEKTGALCKAKDADSLYAQMSRMAMVPSAERQAMGQSGREKMVREFTKQMVIEKTQMALM